MVEDGDFLPHTGWQFLCRPLVPACSRFPDIEKVAPGMAWPVSDMITPPGDFVSPSPVHEYRDDTTSAKRSTGEAIVATQHCGGGNFVWFLLADHCPPCY